MRTHLKALLGAGTVLGVLAGPALAQVSASTYGVNCDGATDNSTALRDWLAALNTGGSLGVLPAGQCNFSQAPLIFAHASWKTVEGQGSTATALVYTGTNTNTDIVVVGGQSATQGPFVLSGFRITSTTAMTGGAALHVQNAAQVKIWDVDADTPIAGGTHRLYHGFWFDQISMVDLADFNTWVQGDGVRISAFGVNQPNPQYDLAVHNGKITGGTIGIHVGGGFDNGHFNNLIVTNNGQNVVVDNAIEPYKNQELVFGSDVVTDQATAGDDYYINDPLANSLNYCQISIQGPITHSNNANGIHVHAWPHCGITVSSPYIINNAQNGILVDDATSFLTIASSTQILGNLQYGMAASVPNYSGLYSTGTVVFNTMGAYNANVAVPSR